MSRFIKSDTLTLNFHKNNWVCYIYYNFSNDSNRSQCISRELLGTSRFFLQILFDIFWSYFFVLSRHPRYRRILHRYSRVHTVELPNMAIDTIFVCPTTPDNVTTKPPFLLYVAAQYPESKYITQYRMMKHLQSTR